MSTVGLNVGLARLFGTKLVSDIPERFCAWGVRPHLDAKRHARLQAIERTRLLFIHVPKNAGMSISSALYGLQIKHASVRYYLSVAPHTLREFDSMAVIRDPVQRFISAFDYARAGGSGDNRISAPFRKTYMEFRSLDDALDHVEKAATPFQIDHIFRPQSWYVTDCAGELRVRRLVPFSQVGELLAGCTSAPPVNCRREAPTKATAAQVERIRLLYRSDTRLLAACDLGSKGLERRDLGGRSAIRTTAQPFAGARTFGPR